MKRIIIFIIGLGLALSIYSFTKAPLDAPKAVHLTISGTDYFDLYGGTLCCDFVFSGAGGNYIIEDCTPIYDVNEDHYVFSASSGGDSWVSFNIYGCSVGTFNYFGISGINNNPNSPTTEITISYQTGCK